MTAAEAEAPELFAEPGSTWWPVLWGPAFAVVGAGAEALAGPVHTIAWVLVGLALAGGAAIWVNARRRLLSVRLTPTTLVQGRETLGVHSIERVEETEQQMGARVLGGGWAVPRKFIGFPVQLDDGSTVLAWARDGDGLRDALRGLVSG